MKLVIVDYGSGNLRSVEKALATAANTNGYGHEITVSACPDRVAETDYLVLPGVGAFADCRAGLEAIDGMTEAIGHAVLEKQRPFLGICVGMQLMAERGLEGGMDTPGLGWIKGSITALEPPLKPDKIRLKVPHMGWNKLTREKPAPIFDGLDDDAMVYFLHGYHLTGADPEQVLAVTRYGDDIVAAVAVDTMTGLQFHPEKSQHAGQIILRNWLGWAP